MSRRKKQAVNQFKSGYYSLLSSFRPKPRITISQWADNYRFIAEGLSSMPGKWDTDNTPYMREVLDVFNQHEVNQVVVMASSQVGKTEIGLNMIGYYSHQEPSAIMYLLPTDDVAKKFSETRVKTTIESTPVLNALFTNKSRNAANANDLKSFPGGFLTINGANTPNNLASFPIRILIQDEIDRFTRVIKGEGDPIQLARQRTATYSNAKELLISTPTIKKQSRIWEAYQETDQREYFVNCPDCDHEFTFEWEYVRWEVDKNRNLINKSVYIECPACFYHINERQRREMVRKGRWKPTKPNRKIPGFHISTLYSTIMSFSKLVQEYITAQDWLDTTNDPTKMQVFYNLKLGLPFDMVLADIDPEQLMRRRERYNCELPDGVLYITCGVDTQDDRLEYQIIGWGEGYEDWLLQYGVINGDLSLEAPWLELDDVLMKRYYFDDGRSLPISMTFIDSGGHKTNEVYKYTMSRNHLGIYPIKGYAGEKSIVQGITKNNIYRTDMVLVGVNAAKSRIFYKLGIDEIGVGYSHFPIEPYANCDLHFFEMLVSEVQETVPQNGQYVQKWRKIRERNEALDTRVYALAALEILMPDFEKQKMLVDSLPTMEQQTQVVRNNNKRRIVSSLGKYK